MLRCVSVAPFGKPVVPLVNWMLMGSLAWRDRDSLRSDGSSADPVFKRSEKLRISGMSSTLSGNCPGASTIRRDADEVAAPISASIRNDLEAQWQAAAIYHV